MLRRHALWIGIALLILLSTLPARAQSQATLGGVVRGPDNAPISGATVVATSRATKETRTTTTGADGAYSLLVVPGSYDVKVDATGFPRLAVTVDVVADHANKLDLAMKPIVSEVVTVTALKRETAPIDVPFSVAALSGKELEDRGAENLEGVAANVVGLTVQNLGPGQSQVAMRGVSAGQIARDQPGVKEQVGLYLDESPVSMSLYTPDLDLFDVSRVEVLRGPQGTLFGSGSVTGTVRYVTNPPVLQQTDSFVEAGLGIVDGGGGTGDIKAGVNVPLGDEMALRVVGYYTGTPGFTQDIQPDLSVNEDTNDGYRTGGRAAMTFAPNDKLTITPRVTYQHVESNGWNREDIYNVLANPFTTSRPPVTFDDRQQFTQSPERYTDEFGLASLDIRYDFGKMVLTSISSYLNRDVNVTRDTTALTASFTGGTLGFPEPIYTLDSPMYDTTSASTLSQELRLSAERERMTWVTGLFYSRISRDYGQNVTVPGFEDMTGIPTEGILAPKDSLYFSDFDYRLDQIAVFGEATWKMSARFDLTGGLRYYDFDEDKRALIDGVIDNPNNGTSVLAFPGKTDANGFAPRVIASYELSANHFLNAQVSRGFRLGGVNDPLNAPLCSPEDLATFGGHDSWDDETVWNYELGYKAKVLGGSGSLNASAYYLDITDLQTTVTAGTCTSRVVFNVPHARTQGVELEFREAPSTHFDFSISGAFNDAELRSTLTSTDTDGNVSIVSGIEAGRRLPTVPRVQAAAAATYRFDALKHSQGYVTGSYEYVGSRFTQVGDEDLGTLDLTALPNPIGGPLTQTTFTYDPELPAYGILNLRVGLRWQEWEVAAFVNNATDELALLAFDRERGTLARIGYLTNQPRTFGLTTRFNF